MKHIAALLAMIALLVFGCATDDSTTPEDTTPRISFDPTSITISAGDSATVSVNVENLPQGIFALTTQIEFNSNSISISEESIVTGDYFADGAIIFAHVDDSYLSVGVSSTRGSGVGGGSGTVFELRIRAEWLGTGEMIFTPGATHLYDENADVIELDSIGYENATVTVTN